MSAGICKFVYLIWNVIILCETQKELVAFGNKLNYNERAVAAAAFETTEIIFYEKPVL